MKFDPNRRHRRSVRLKGYDYSQAGAYFITICVSGRAFLFGSIVGDGMHLNGFGKVIDEEWMNTASIRSQVELDEYVVMPNHFHAIVAIDDSRRGERLFAPNRVHASERRGVLRYAPTSQNDHTLPNGQTTLRSPSQTIGAVVRGFKSAAAKRINEMRGTPGVPVWQRNYYDHIIRNENELGRIREYIVNNPVQWALDRENPNRRGEQPFAQRDEIEAIFGGICP